MSYNTCDPYGIIRVPQFCNGIPHQVGQRFCVSHISFLLLEEDKASCAACSIVMGLMTPDLRLRRRLMRDPFIRYIFVTSKICRVGHQSLYCPNHLLI